MITINLLPWREEVRKAKIIRAGLIAAGFALVAMAIVLSLHIYLSVLISNQQKKNDYLQSVINSEKIELTSLNDKKKQVEAIQSEIQHIVSLRKTSYQSIKLLDTLPRIIPDSVTLTKITKEQSNITLYGKSKSNIQITYLMKTIANMPIFKKQELIEITERKEAGDEGRFFQIKMQHKE